MDTETVRAEWSLRSNRERDWNAKDESDKVTAGHGHPQYPAIVRRSTSTTSSPMVRKRTQQGARGSTKIARARRSVSWFEIDPHVRFLNEGPGAVYFTVHQRDGGELIKWGQSTDVPCRQLDYDACEDDGGTQMWVVAFEVEHRLIAERVIHLRLLQKGYKRVRFYEPCSCGHRHREYHYMRPDGSLEDFETIARECLEELGKFFAHAGDVHNTLCQIPQTPTLMSCSLVTVCLNEPKNEWKRKRKYEDMYGRKQQDRGSAVGVLRIPMWLDNEEQNRQWRIRRLLSTGAFSAVSQMITCMASDDADDPRLASRWG
ncbi:hypothetical protein C8R45DRAFT_928906 [Mycena sanguinolenta]|nr:hypothetical protein C8R45DRAFT_928906 [Mycena sanguinolenta]